MTLSVGDTLPNATLRYFGDDGPATRSIEEITKGRKVVIFGLPGAYTRTCSAAHVPSFIRTKDQFDAKGIDEVICVSVNDVFVIFLNNGQIYFKSLFNSIFLLCNCLLFRCTLSIQQCLLF